MYSLIIHFGIKQYELSVTIDIGLLYMYHLSVLPPKQHTIPLIVSRQISIPNVSPDLTDVHYTVYIIRTHAEQILPLSDQMSVYGHVTPVAIPIAICVDARDYKPEVVNLCVIKSKCLDHLANLLPDCPNGKPNGAQCSYCRPIRQYYIATCPPRVRLVSSMCVKL